MKKNHTTQEILLLTDSTFSKRELCGDDAATGPGESTRYDKLEAACWNGLINEWLPAAITKGCGSERLFLWKVNVANKILCMELSEVPSSIDSYFSLDPYLFVPTQHNN